MSRRLGLEDTVGKGLRGPPSPTLTQLVSESLGPRAARMAATDGGGRETIFKILILKITY